MSTYRGETSATQSVFEVIERNPGCSTQDISRMLSSFDLKTVKRALENLRDNRDQIENRGGGRGRDDAFYEFAGQILAEMRGMRPGMRQAYLADQLEDAAIGVKP